MQNTIWRRFSGDFLNETLETTLLKDIAKAPTDVVLKFYVGGDSQYHKGVVKYVTVLILRMCGKGAIGYYTIQKSKKYTTIQQRLFMETYQAVDLAVKINPILERMGYKINKIHTDLNPDPIHASHDMVKTCLGYIQGFGFEGVLKPDSWASSCVADYKTR